jgi:cytochrome c oxidase subunit 2
MISSLLAQRSFWLEPPASTSAQNHDLVFYALLYTMAFFFFLVVAIMLAFVVRYRRRKGQAYDDAPTHNTPLEVFWTVIPLGIVIAFFVVGLRYYVELEAPPAGAVVVDVEASQWQFNFKYPNGAESNELYLLVDRPVVLKLASKDVTHALYIPAFRVQRNAVPGQDTEIWFKPTVPTDKDPATGEESFYHVFCTQYCGNGHAEMNTKAFVLNKEDYDKKLAEAANIFVDKTSKQPLPYAEVGKKLYATMGCSQCHSINGSQGQGPTWKGLYKSDVEFSKSNVPGYTLKESDDDAKWDAYLRESILQPDVKIVQGFQNVMPPQESALSGSPYKEKKLATLVEYVKSLGNPKYYAPMKTPELPSGSTPGGAAQPQSPDKAPGTANPQATETPQAKEKPQAADRFADRPADLPIDKSAAPAVKKEQEK